MKLAVCLALLLPCISFAESEPVPDVQELAAQAHKDFEGLKEAIENPSTAHKDDLIAFRKKYNALAKNDEYRQVQAALRAIFKKQHKLDRKAELDARTERRKKGDPNAEKLGLQWISIPAGSFDMGNPKSDADADDVPVHQVTLEAFELTHSPITVKQYMQCVAAKACPKPQKGSKFDSAFHCNWSFKDRSNFPMNCVSYNEASAFAAWVGGRLPSEAEWEYAARNQGKTTYPWGETMPDEDAQPTFYFYGAAFQYPTTVAVCSTPKGNTQNGLCDMVGNVEEWVADTYEESYDLTPTDGSAHLIKYKKDAKNERAEHLTRGRGGDDAAFIRYPQYNMTEFKKSEDADGAYGIGFRVAR